MNKMDIFIAYLRFSVWAARYLRGDFDEQDVDSLLQDREEALRGIARMLTDEQKEALDKLVSEALS